MARRCAPASASRPVVTSIRSVSMSQKTRAVFVTGGTGYIGAALIPSLLSRGHSVRALTRPASSQRLPVGVTPVVGDVRESGNS